MKYGELNLGQIEAIVNKLGGMDGVQHFLSGELVIKTPELLRQVVTVPVDGVKKFVVTDHFKVGTVNSVRIAWLGDNFEQVMLGKVEENIPAATLTAHALTKASLDAPIMVELSNRAETFLAHLWELLRKQPKGESGALLTNSCANIFYVRETDGNLCVVSADWGSGGWHVGARSVGNPLRWGAGCQVFSC